MEKPGKNQNHGTSGHSGHAILANSTALTIGALLLLLTIITVAVAHFDLGKLNFLIAVLIASVKGCLVVLFFMNLRNEQKENGVIFFSSFVFLAIFIILTSTDLFFRGDVGVKGPLMAVAAQSGGGSKIAKPWLSTPAQVAHGKELFAAQCVACHGAEGKGNGPAAAALVPPPRNFTAATGWKNGRKPSQVFKTLKEGLPGSSMASFGTLPADDRWALVHFVVSLGAAPEADTPADLAKIGIDPNKAGGGDAAEAATIPVDFAMKRLAKADLHSEPAAAPAAPTSAAGRIYAAQCMSCHGGRGEGGIKVKRLGVVPEAFVITSPLSAQMAGMRSAEEFAKVVVQGMPGDLMPGIALGAQQLSELYQYTKGLAGSSK